MDVGEVIEALRRDYRACAGPGETIEPMRFVTRHTIPSIGIHFVTAHALTAEIADAFISAEIAVHMARGHPFEWKLFSYDEPSDLRQRLANQGFVIGEPEAVMIYDLHDGLAPFTTPCEADVRRIEREEDLEDFRVASSEAFGKDYAPTTNALAEAIRNREKGHTAFVAYLGGEPTSVGRLYTSPNSLFAGLYGGGTRPQYRRRGLYRSIVAARAREAAKLGARYLLVDARPTSQPILESLGFVHVADTWPCDSPVKP